MDEVPLSCRVIEPLKRLQKLTLFFLMDKELYLWETAIEGNTLSLIETKVLLEDKISIGGKNLRTKESGLEYFNALESYTVDTIFPKLMAKA